MARRPTNKAAADALRHMLLGTQPRAPRRRITATRQVFQIKITLARMRPPIWRRVLVRSDATIADLHSIFQIAMGWNGEHLHQFEIAGERFSSSDPEYGVHPDELDSTDGGNITVGQVIPGKGGKFTYEYDFGDGWLHQCVVEAVAPAPPDARLAKCTAGKRACPPEDCGGPWGYAELLELHANPQSDDPDGRREWVSDSFDPAAFDIEAVNDALAVPDHPRA